jgi:16S rRNA (guanine966-N2)-methyltransferase
MGTKQKPNRGIRIIGGQWRGRRFGVPDIPGLRPSGDRVRETLFNWLHPYLHQAEVADLFAGTGILGLEAASRGAAHVTLIEKSRQACESIEQTLSRLGADDVTLIQADALGWLTGSDRELDLVFVDPPFGQGLAQKALHLLDQGKQLKNGAIVYLETGCTEPLIPPPGGWSILKEKTIGDVTLRLYKKIIEIN